jgi:hypothetical protein
MIDKIVNSSNPTRLDLKGDLATLGKLDRSAAAEMLHFQQSMTNNTFQSDETIVTSTNADIFGVDDKTSSEYVTTKSLVNLSRAGVINRDDFVKTQRAGTHPRQYGRVREEQVAETAQRLRRPELQACDVNPVAPWLP